MTVDYTQPIVCAENGVWLKVVHGPDEHGEYLCDPAPGNWPDGYSLGLYCDLSGEMPSGPPFTVRNATPAECAEHYAKQAGGEFVPGAVAEPEDYPLWPVAVEAWARVLDARAFRRHAGQVRRGKPSNDDRKAITELLAIIKEQRAKPEVTEADARELLARWHDEIGYPAIAVVIRGGARYRHIQAMLRAMRSMP